ncbi:hypothetical protein QOZ80_8BG0652890 [Eleusine coracana subsp. coracana]|nr:hypothetical protein QOZ80_8BG0652890 [Eleusine coracana subsp. coracana]
MATGGDKPLSLDDDIDIDMVDPAPSNAPATSSAAGAGATRFAPRVKGKAMLKPKPKPKPMPKPEPGPKLEPEPERETEVPPAPLQEDGGDAMDVDVAGKVAAPEAEEDEDDEEDFVVREIDVYFTPKPFDDDGKLYVMQFPLKPCWRPYELNEICEEVRVKPLSSKVEIDLNVDTQSENYDQDVSAPLRLTKQTLSSSKAADVADYAVGVLKGNLVHLNHIDAVLQLRPSMSYVNSGRSHANQQVSQARETNGGTSGSMVPSVKGNERPQESKENAEVSEPWISLTYQPAGSDIATSYHDKMVSNEGGPIDFTMNIPDYVMSLCPGASTGSKRINRCQAIRQMVSLPLGDRLKKWFTEVSEVNQFDAVMHLAPTYSEEEILKVLPEYADLVRGLWVCKSSLLINDGREILKDYKFISAADLSFIRRYPRVVNEQEYAWSARELTIRDSQVVYSTVARNSKNSTRSNVTSGGPHSNISKGKDTPSQGGESHVITVLGNVFVANKVRSMQAIIRDLRQLAAKYASNRKDASKLQALANAAKSCASLPHEELEEMLKTISVPVHGVYIAKQTERNTLRNILIYLFRKKEPNATLTKQEILDSAVVHLKREVSEKEYHQNVTEICNSTEDGHLILKKGDEP